MYIFDVMTSMYTFNVLEQVFIVNQTFVVGFLLGGVAKCPLPPVTRMTSLGTAVHPSTPIENTLLTMPYAAVGKS